jgi:hypothetical protein
MPAPSFKILDRSPTIQKKLREALLEKYNQSLGSDFETRLGEILDRLHDFIAEKFFASPTYESLTSGKLRADFGFSDEYLPEIDEAINWMLELDAHYEVIGQKIVMKIDFRANTDNVRFYDSNGHRIDWLDWLLYADTDEVVANYKVKYKEGHGRSHMAVMIGSDDSFSFSVDPAFAGKENDNWISKTLKSNVLGIKNFLKKEMNNAFKQS